MASETYWVVKDDDDHYFMNAESGRMHFVHDRGRAKKYPTLRAAFAGARLCRRKWDLDIRVMRVGPEVPRDLILTGEAARLVREWRAARDTGLEWSAEREMLAALAGEEVCDG